MSPTVHTLRGIAPLSRIPGASSMQVCSRPRHACFRGGPGLRMEVRPTDQSGCLRKPVAPCRCQPPRTEPSAWLWHHKQRSRSDSLRRHASSRASASDTAAPESDTQPSEETDRYAGLSETEILRRKRISMANKGKQPWNKGRKHSEATKAKIRARTREAMKRPEVIDKLRKLPHPKHNKEIKEKIRRSLVSFYDRKGRKHPRLTEEEKAEMQRQKQEERGKARAKARASPAAKSKNPSMRGKGQRSLQHRMKIAEAIRAKWEDPQYRSKVQNGMLADGVQELRVQKMTTAQRAAKEQEEMAEGRALMRTCAQTLVGKAKATVKGLEAQVNQLDHQPALQLRAKAALEQAQGVLRKAEAQYAQVVMETAMAAKSAVDSYDRLDLEQEASEPTNREDNRTLGDGTRSSSSASAHVHVNGTGQHQVNGKALHTNGNSVKSLHGNGHKRPVVTGQPVVNGQAVKASVRFADAQAALHMNGTSAKMVNNQSAHPLPDEVFSVEVAFDVEPEDQSESDEDIAREINDEKPETEPPRQIWRNGRLISDE